MGEGLGRTTSNQITISDDDTLVVAKWNLSDASLKDKMTFFFFFPVLSEIKWLNKESYLCRYAPNHGSPFDQSS